MEITYHEHTGEQAQAEWPKVEPLAIRLLGQSAYSSRVKFHHQIHLLTAQVDEQIIGFKVGYLDRPGRFTSWLGGVDNAWRNQGIASELTRRQHIYVSSIQCPKIWTITASDNHPMLQLNLKHGFNVIGSYTNTKGRCKLILECIL